MAEKPRSQVNFSVEEEDKVYFRLRHSCEENDQKDVELEKVEEVEGFPVMECPKCQEEVVLGVFTQKETEEVKSE